MSTRSSQRIFLKPGELNISARPTIVTTLLGSCVSITMFNSRLRIGAICHAVLPISKNSTTLQEVSKYVDSSIFYMLKVLESVGVQRLEIVVKMFGSSEIIQNRVTGNNFKSVGRQNIEIVKQIINTEQLNLIASNVGGEFGRKILFNT